MSYDISLLDPVSKEVIKADAIHQMRGGTFAVFGTRDLSLNVTYNYSKFYYRPEVFGNRGIRAIYGMSGADSIPVIEKAIAALGDDINPDYWEATEGNAKRPLTMLLAMAKIRPDGIWDGD